MLIRPFGEIDPDNLEEYYSGKIAVGGLTTEIDLNFESDSVGPEIVEQVPEFIESIDDKIKSAFDAISADYDRGEESETARFYLEHHLTELSEDEIHEIFGTTNITKKEFFEKLSVRRIGIYPEDEESYATIDITLPDKYTDYLMAVTFSCDGELSFISMES